MKQGDVFAVPISDRGGVATLFSACGKDVTEQVVFLKVTELSPEWQTSLMIDSAKTRVSLEVSHKFRALPAELAAGNLNCKGFTNCHWNLEAIDFMPGHAACI
jgi:hypothetical protein